MGGPNCSKVSLVRYFEKVTSTSSLLWGSLQARVRFRVGVGVRVRARVRVRVRVRVRG